MLNYLFALPKDSAKSSGGYNVFPVGIAYVTAYLKQHGHRVFTANLEFSPDSTYDALSHLIHAHSIDVLCTGGLSRDLPRVQELVDAAKSIESKIVTVVGGGLVTGDPEPAMTALGADIGVIGQGEITMQELAHALDNDLPHDDIAGLIHRRQGAYFKTGARKDVRNLDDLPMPDYEGFAFPEYLRQTGYACAYITASRSCPFKCTFCFHPSGTVYRRRSLDSVFAEIDHLLAKYPLRSIVISDELFAPNRERVIEFCRRIAPYGLPWDVQLRVSDVDGEMLDTMRNAGCRSISYGIESADDTVLASMKKKITVAQIDRALELTHQRQIDIQGGLIFGDAAETPITAANSLAWFEARRQYGLELNMISIFPGTPLYELACSRGIIRDRVEFLRAGCPLINVSHLSDTEYRLLASRIYENNMRAKHPPKEYSIRDVQPDGSCRIDITCDRCGNAFSIRSDGLHVVRSHCDRCRQRYYLDPFASCAHTRELTGAVLAGDEPVALWGSGEICIKMLDRYPALQEERFVVVDKSKSRQAFTVCGKPIMSPAVIEELGITTVIVTVVRRTHEVLADLAVYPQVSRVYRPGIMVRNGRSHFTLFPTAPNDASSEAPTPVTAEPL